MLAIRPKKSLQIWGLNAFSYMLNSYKISPWPSKVKSFQNIGEALKNAENGFIFHFILLVAFFMHC